MYINKIVVHLFKCTLIIYKKFKTYHMKRHQFYFEFLPQSCLLGLCISQYESQLPNDTYWYQTFRIEIGFIFFTLSYTKTSI
jgi:hypothetical protein